MADKTSTTLVPITFTAGEQPPADKLTAITAQLRAGVGKMEALLGDPHGEGFPYASALATQLSPAWGRSVTSNAPLQDTGLSPASEKRLDIANIARLIGPASNLSPKMQSEASQITETIPSGTTSYQLRYKPDDPNGANTPTITGSDWTTYQTTGILTASTDWHVSDRGYVTSLTALTGNRSITYTTDPSKYGNGSAYQGANFNVIPSPNQINSTGSGVTVAAASGGKHRVTFPTITHQQSNKDLDLTELGHPDFNYALNYTLPQIIQTLSSGDVIPSGFVVLYNHTTSVAYTEAQYEYVSPTELDISGIDLDSEIGAGNVFYVITVGTDITTSIDDLRNKLSEHTHDGTFGEQPIKASDIVGWNETANEFLPSGIDDNPAPQYLRRTGYQPDSQGYNDDNMMIGSIGLGEDGAARGSAVSSTGATYKLFFGNANWNVYRNSNNHLESNTDAADEYWLMNHALNVSQDTGIGAGVDIENTSVFTDASSGGHIGTRYGSFYGQSLLAGPYNGSVTDNTKKLTKWEIDADGITSSGSGATFETDGTSNYWVTPRHQVIYFARRLDKNDSNVTISTGNTITGSGAVTGGSTTYSEILIELPEYLQFTASGASSSDDWSFTTVNANVQNAIMASSILIRSESGSSSTRWHAAGFDSESIVITNASHNVAHNAASSEVVSYSIGSDGIKIRIVEAGDFATSNWGTTSNDLAVKITLWVAAPGTYLA